MTRYVCDKQHDQYIKIVAIEEEIEVEAEVCEICFNEARHKSQMEAIKNSPGIEVSTMTFKGLMRSANYNKRRYNYVHKSKSLKITV